MHQRLSLVAAGALSSMHTLEIDKSVGEGEGWGLRVKGEGAGERSGLSGGGGG